MDYWCSGSYKAEGTEAQEEEQSLVKIRLSRKVKRR